MKMTQVPEWTYQGKQPSIYTFFEAIALSGLENTYIRLDAETQRKLLGHPVFGKRNIKVRHDGHVESYIKIAFGNDFEHTEYHFTKIKQAVEKKKQLRPGYTGINYA